MRRLMVFLMLLGGCSEKKHTAPPPVYAVRVAQALQESVPLFIETLGHVDSMTSIGIHSRIEGELTGIYFAQGSDVKKGDLLFTIDSRPYVAELQSAQGAVEQAKAELLLAEDKVKRYKPLTAMEFYSQLDFETLTSNLDAAKGRLKEAQGHLASAEINLNYCWIYAPIDGLTGIERIDVGNLISADPSSKPLVTLNEMNPIYVSFSIPEAKLHQLQEAKGNLTVLAAYEHFSGNVFTGKLHIIDNAVDEKTGTVKLRGTFPNQERNLWPGQFVRTRLILSHLENAILIPNAAIQLTQKGPIAFVVKQDSTVEQRSLTLGQKQDDLVVALEGICPGEKVVVEGQLNLYPGAHVEISP